MAKKKKSEEERATAPAHRGPKVAGTGRTTISGPPGSGKSTVAKELQEKLGLEVHSAGDIFRKMAKESHMTLEEFGHVAERSWDIDIELDKRMLDLIRARGDAIFEGRMTGYLCYLNDIEALKVHITAPPEVRLRRVMRREAKDKDTVLREMREREMSEQKRYKSIYGYSLDDLQIFDLTIDSSRQKPAEIVDAILGKLRVKA